MQLAKRQKYYTIYKKTNPNAFICNIRNCYMKSICLNEHGHHWFSLCCFVGAKPFLSKCGLTGKWISRNRLHAVELQLKWNDSMRLFKNDINEMSDVLARSIMLRCFHSVCICCSLHMSVTLMFSYSHYKGAQWNIRLYVCSLVITNCRKNENFKCSHCFDI